MSSVNPQPQPIGEATLNTRHGSIVDCLIEPFPTLYFRPETGEFLAVPAQDVCAFENASQEFNDLIRQMQLANETVLNASLALGVEQQKILPNPMIINDLDSCLTAAENTQFDVHTALRDALAPLARLDPDQPPTPLAKLDLTHKKVMELIPVHTGNKGKRQWGNKMTYVRSDKIKSHWRTYALNSKETASADNSFLKKDANGNTKIDTAKLLSQLKDVKVKGNLVDFDENSIGGVLGAWATHWNQSLKAEAKINHNVTFSAQAQLMRYLAGAGVTTEWEPRKGKVSLKATGRAEFAMAEGNAALACHFPHEAGWMLFVTGNDHTRYDLGAIRLKAELELSGLVGASAVAELALAVDVGKDNKAGVKGVPAPKKRNSRALNIGQRPIDPGVAAELEVFAGAKADIALNGSVQWMHTEETKGKFKDFCKVGPGLGAQAGIGAGGMMEITYTDGKFRIRVMASVCLGIGAKGKMELEVDAGLIAEFMKWFFYQLYHADFMRVKIISELTFKAICQIQFMALDAGDKIEAILAREKQNIEDTFNNIVKELDKADRRAQLMNRILSNPHLLQYSTPETKGMIIYQLTRYNKADWAERSNHKGLSVFGHRKDAIKHVLRWAQTKSECDNIIQHMSADGTKGNHKTNFDNIVEFFALEAPKNIDIPVYNSLYDEDFLRWYEKLQERLKPSPTRGYKIAQNDMPEYQQQMIAMRDHPKFGTMMA